MFNVLAVDDSHFILKIIKDLVQRGQSDVQIDLADSGEKALEMLESHSYDLILLDIVMPIVNGYDVLDYLNTHKLLESAKVVMITGNSDPKELKACFDLGATDFITKPINEIEFVARINAAIAEQQLKKMYKRTIESLEQKNNDLEQMQNQLFKAKEQLIQSEQLSGLGFLAAGIAHEINNPLSFIKNNVGVFTKYVQVLLAFLENQPIKSEEVSTSFDGAHLQTQIQSCSPMFIREDLESLNQETIEGINRIETIVNQLRNFSGIDQLDEVEDIELGENVLEVARLLIGEHFAQIDVLPEFESRTLVKVPVGRLNIALISILRNAIESLVASKKTNGCIRLKTWDDAEWAYLNIWDNGCGFEADQISKVFQPFFTTKDVGQGTGLGLTNARNIIVNQLGGQIEFASQWGNYAEVRLRLPLK